MTVLRPAGAVLFLAVPALVAFWVWDRRRRAVLVPTLLLWRRIAPAPAAARRLPADPLFVLELLLVVALATAHLGPAVPGAPPASALAVVVDVSASMGTREAGGTRLALVRRRARAMVAEGTREVMLIAAAERPRVVARWTTDAALVLARLEALEPLDVAGDLGPALAFALAEARARPAARVAVLTDLPRDAVGLPPADVAAVDWVQVGRTDDNVAIARLAVNAPPFHDRADATATVVVRNHAARAREVVLAASVSGVPWARRTLGLGAHATATLVLDRPPAAGELTVVLEGGDALAADDVARAWLPARGPVRLVVVSESDAVARALRTAPGTRLEAVSPAAWTAARGADADAVVFDRVAPPADVRRALWVAPPPGAPCPAAGDAGPATIVDWEDGHPALAALDDPGGATVARAVRLDPPPWAAPVVLAAAAGRAFPLLVVGERDGRRFACLGAPLDDALASSDRLPLYLLALGTLGWLLDADAPRVVETGTSVRVGVPASPTRGLRVAGDAVVAERAGAYRVGGRLLLANFVDDRESEVGRDGGGEWRATVDLAVASGARGARDLGPAVAAAAAALLVAEWLAWLLRRA